MWVSKIGFIPAVMSWEQTQSCSYSCSGLPCGRLKSVSNLSWSSSKWKVKGINTPPHLPNIHTHTHTPFCITTSAYLPQYARISSCRLKSLLSQDTDLVLSRTWSPISSRMGVFVVADNTGSLLSLLGDFDTENSIPFNLKKNGCQSETDSCRDFS